MTNTAIGVTDKTTGMMTQPQFEAPFRHAIMPLTDDTILERNAMTMRENPRIPNGRTSGCDQAVKLGFAGSAITKRIPTTLQYTVTLNARQDIAFSFSGGIEIPQ
jgi:hypothetical protein